MNLDDIKEQLRDQLNTTWGRIQESSAYNTLREKYEALPVVQQKALGVAGLIFVVLILLWFPYSYLSSSGTLMTEFDEKRSVIRELLRVSRQSEALPPIPQGPSLDALQQSVDQVFNSANLMAEQRGQVMSTSSKNGVAFVPPTVTQQAFAVDAKKLNLKQILDIGFELSKLYAALKLMDVEIQSAADAPTPGYFDVVFKLVSFNFPHMESGEENTGTGKSGFSNKRGSARPAPSHQAAPPPETLPADDLPPPTEGE